VNRAERVSLLEDLVRDLVDAQLRAAERVELVRAEILSSVGVWGPELEEFVRLLMRTFVVETKGVDLADVRRVGFLDEARVYRPYESYVEVDVVEAPSGLWLVEVRGAVDGADVADFFNKARAYEARFGRRPDRMLMVALNADRSALETAEALGVDLLYARDLGGEGG